jgi:hypothetical protein
MIFILIFNFLVLNEVVPDIEYSDMLKFFLFGSV